MSVQPTPHQAVNDLLEKLLSGAQSVLQNNFAGLYLYGSLASGDFDRQKSDIDFLVVTFDEISDEGIRFLKAMHENLWQSGGKLAAKLEGSYVPLEDLRRYESNEKEYPSINEGKFYLGRHDSDWIIQRHILREQAVAIAGAPLENSIDQVQPDDLRRAVADLLNEWWSPMLENPAFIKNSEYETYTVLTMCRALFTLEHGTTLQSRLRRVGRKTH
ncbi:MAG TPA: nucleotidyltransferase domain-containing protein [Pyrinomonadaceae bacterium]|nr:nucleotidyltransferase domain-containing protein [Pyrinomonadaceae bacterium]